ncbi:hypothetical protein F3Y22_tig00111330pilonHSYRG00620 [Hibiscus syriacus]|uniref:acetyl-CoA carboxytransferase n=1 Tax=Hibiscus syriacus TaxID=106335 RepID=A0A6A2YPX5_HIBSY|nr:hypothetical protein F3Y22_tig00111330pilonHSYRG00620 [Hibiscus syriacus]
MKLSVLIASRPVTVLIPLALLVLLPPSVVITWWYKTTRKIGEDVDLNTQIFHSGFLSQIDTISKSIPPLSSSAANLVMLLSYSFNKTDEILFTDIESKVAPTLFLAFQPFLICLRIHMLDQRVCRMADETGLDFTAQIGALESKYQQLELHGDRAGYDDPAMVTGIGTMDGKSYMFIGRQKGRSTKENMFLQFRNANSPWYADHHGLPIITMVDTPGAYADLKSEELGQVLSNNLPTFEIVI